MLFRKLGSSDMKVSLLGCGCWPFGGDWTGVCDEESIKTINLAIELGINFFDVAPVYGFGHAEEILGKAVKDKRDKIYIASKCGLRWDNQKRIKRDLSKNSILEEIDNTLKRLETDYIDLYQLHWPDPNTPIEETMDTLNMLKQKGKIRNIGLSNFSVFLIEEAKKYGQVVSDQVLFNIIDRNSDHYHDLPLCYRTESEILSYAENNEIGIIPYSPLAQGLLTENFDVYSLSSNDVRNANPELKKEKLAKNLKIVNKMREISNESGYTIQHLALNWLASYREISTIIAASKNREELKQNVSSIENQIDDNVIRKINQFLKNF